MKDPRRKRAAVKARTLWKKSLVFNGPKTLDLFNSSGEIVCDEFVVQAEEIVAIAKADMECKFPKEAPFLPPQLRSLNGRKTLVLDIDETLVHSVQTVDKDVIYDHTFDVEYLGIRRTIGMNKRPFVEQFLAWCGEHFEVVTFTSGIKPYSDQVMKILDPKGEIVKHRLSRDHCMMHTESIYFKNLEYLRRDLTQTLIVDNSPIVFAFQLDNGVPIEPYYGEEKEDIELLKLKNFLEEVLKAEDVRLLIQKKFKMRAFLAYVDANLKASKIAA